MIPHAVGGCEWTCRRMRPSRFSAVQRSAIAIKGRNQHNHADEDRGKRSKADAECDFAVMGDEVAGITKQLQAEAQLVFWL